MIHDTCIDSLRILYVEDDLSTQEEVAFFLTPLVKELYLASDGQQGLEMFKRHTPDLIITDIQMPILNGLEMIKEIRMINPKIPIFVTTAYNETNYLLSAINSGVNRYILKPINFKTLLETMNEFFSHDTSYPYSVCVNRDGKIAHIAVGWSELSGYNLDELIGTMLEDYIDPRDLETYRLLLNHIETPEEYLKQKFRLIDKNKNLIETVLYAVHTDDQKLIFQFEFKTLSSYIHDEELLTKALETERFIKELIKMNTLIYKEIAGITDTKIFYQRLSNLFTHHDLFEFSFVAYADEKDEIVIVEQGSHSALDIKKVFPEKTSLHAIECPMAESIKRQEIVIIEDLDAFGDFQNKSIFLKHNIKSIVAIPLYPRSNQTQCGAFCLLLNKSYKLNNEVLDLFSNITEALNMGLETINQRKEHELLEDERKKYEEMIEQLAFYDTLTHLPNRRLFSDHLSQAIAFNKRSGHFGALLFLDLDNFKPLNDQYGHPVGDLLLIEVALRIEMSIRESDIVARFGGDEFVVLLHDLGDEPIASVNYAIAIAEKIRVSLSEPYFLKINTDSIENFMVEYHATSSIGIALFGSDDEEHTLITQADSAMYQSKEAGRNTIVVYKLNSTDEMMGNVKLPKRKFEVLCQRLIQWCRKK